MATFKEFKTPFTNMSFTPDIPSAALQPTEYNAGYNVETDTRGIRCVFGDEKIFEDLFADYAAGIDGTIVFITSNYRASNVFWFVFATDTGRWYALSVAGIINVTPGYDSVTNPNAALAGYYDGQPITASWNGTVLFVNDSLYAPMYLLPDGIVFEQYSQTVVNITGASGTGTTATLTFASISPQPFNIGDTVTVSSMNPPDYNGVYTLTGASTTSISYASTAFDTFVSGGYVTPYEYVWNYNPEWKSVTAGFMRLYSTPNVGSILIAGNLTAIDQTDTTLQYPITVQWSQAFGLNSGPLTWAPTATNVANQLEVPVRGPLLDGFSMGGNFYVCSYWDTVIFSPINYTATSTPILGVRLLSQGRGLLNENCWANADTLVYGLDARDIWLFDGSNFKPLGNQRVKDYFYSNLNANYTSRVFVINNTQKNQIEIYYPDLNSTGWCNKMLGYRYDLDVFNPPRDISNATSATESPVYTETGNVWDYNNASRTVVYSTSISNEYLIQKDQGTSFLGNAISSQFRRDNLSLGQTYSAQILLHRLLPEAVNINTNGLQLANSTGNITVTVGGSNSVGQVPTFKPPVTITLNTDYPWTQINQNAYRINTVEVSNSSSTDTWLLSAINWQFTPTQDAR